MTRVAINGAAGRMGRRLVALAAEEGLKVVAAVESRGHELLGKDAGELAGIGPIGIEVADHLQTPADVVIDFSAPAATRQILQACRQQGLPLVIGTTGLDAQLTAELDQAARQVAVLASANMSLGVNLLLDLVGRLAAKLADDYDIEIVEAHHRFKKDAPSGTALALAAAIGAATGQSLQKDVVHGRQGANVPRQRGEIGIHALRGGDLVGRHTVSFLGLGEEISISHLATNRDVFARGALRAAKWLAPKPPGRYSMKDVLGL